MASFGKLSNSLVSATCENTLALVNINADFSLIRCEAAPEYAPVGLALTNRRRKEAENGPIHAIACKLGFLFHELLPADTTKLFKAYGIRTSEILAGPNINPQGTKDDGPFQDFVGADCTSIWAAATCGPASIGVLLLACMLARAWDYKQATSIWVELVEERRAQIQSQLQANRIVHPHSIAAANQQIGRTELAGWDTSVRSWLRRADKSMTLQHTQFKLIVDNLSMPFTSTGSTFEKVISSWVRSMDVMERLLGNLPQEACDRAVLLAISSWHIYPDLLVFQEKANKIPLNDDLVPACGVLSLGLEHRGNSQYLTQWSLALSHLRYYGDSVAVRSRVDSSRLSISQLWFPVLGALFNQWKVPYTNFESAVEWLRDLHGVLSRAGAEAKRAELSWILNLSSTAASITKSNWATTSNLIKHGYRHGKNFLGADRNAPHSPFFGLCNRHMMAAMSEPTNPDNGISYMRGIASSTSLKKYHLFVYYSTNLNDKTIYTEWATVRPIQRVLGQGVGYRAFDEDVNTTVESHVRWIHISRKNEGVRLDGLLEKRCREIQAAGEVCFIDTETCGRELEKTWASPNRYCSWRNPPSLFGHDVDVVEFEFLKSHQADSITISLARENKANERINHSKVEQALWTEALRTSPLDEGKAWLSGISPDKIVHYLLQSMFTKVR